MNRQVSSSVSPDLLVREFPRRRVFVELSDEQVAVVFASRGECAAPPVFPDDGEPTAESIQAEFSVVIRDRTVVGSLLLGLHVLACLPLDGSSRTLTEVARQVQREPATVYRYLITLVKVGVLVRDQETRAYHLA